LLAESRGGFRYGPPDKGGSDAILVFCQSWTFGLGGLFCGQEECHAGANAGL
jgi:hypothetical protein